MRELEIAAATMDTASHGQFLAQAMDALRDPDVWIDHTAAEAEAEAPIRAVRLLIALTGTPQGSRPEPRRAIEDVGAWLEQRLVREPTVQTSDLLVELGWLKRFAKVNGSRRQRSRTDTARPGAPRRLGVNFVSIETKRLEKLRQKGEVRDAPAQLERAPAHAATSPAPASFKTDAPLADGTAGAVSALPDELAVEFKDFARAREARATFAKRARAGKPAKEELIELVAVDRHAAPGRRILCSSTQTAGMAAVFERIASTPGAPRWRLRATDLTFNADGALFVGSVHVRG